MLIPEPVLGAVLIFSISYIMAGGFSTLASVELDDRRIFVIFVSIIFSIATMIPGLWTFLPKEIALVLLSPIVMGTVILLFMNTLTSLGTRHRAQFTAGTDAAAIPRLNEKLKALCQQWCVSKTLCQNLTFGLDAVAESLCVNGVDNELKIDLAYDRMQIKIKLTADHPNIPQPGAKNNDSPDELDLALLMLKNRFDHVRWERKGSKLILNIDADL